MAAPLSVAVVGCGTAGPAAALLLALAGHRVALFEQTPVPGPVGAGILLQPGGLRALERLGLLEPVLALGSPVHRLRGLLKSGHCVLDLKYADLAPGLFGLGIHRGVLFQTLFRAGVAEPNVELHLGVRVGRVTHRANGSAVLRDAAGRAWGPFGLVAVADGRA